MSINYSINLIARNEGIEYRDESGTYRFNVYLSKGVWYLYLPCSRDDNFDSYYLSDEEQDRILPKIITYLKNVKWFGIFSPKYDVIVTHE